jgi:HTH-type transcriptional regulator / antitoxin HipB
VGARAGGRYIVPIGTVIITDPTTLGAALREARRARGLRLEDVAFGAGVGIRFLSELERGKPTARLAEALRVAASLGVRILLEDSE